MLDEVYIGLMSGTSMDAADGVLVRFGDRQMALLAYASLPYPPELRQAVEQLMHERFSARELGDIDSAVGSLFADVGATLAKEASQQGLKVRAIGCHGQTIWHAPDAPIPYSLQIGNPHLVASRTGLPTVADFRRRDMLDGGQGAPLVPAFHQWLFGAQGRTRAILNLGGIANISVMQGDELLAGFDTGPANTLMDAWCQRHTGAPYDLNGQWARMGHCQDALLNRLMSDPYFSLPAPKSTGREYFNPGWLDAALSGQTWAPVDVQRTLLELTAWSAAQGIRHTADVDEVFVCGGGAFNGLLMERLSAHLLERTTLATTQACGLHPQWVEACAFAWLAMRRLHGLPGNLPAATGARSLQVLGALYPG